ncbi:MAG: glycogen debranching enzyme [Abditibacteriota bacterium]|nr:glycogen debranching enzyme [Abditibacteriota bacterium]
MDFTQMKTGPGDHSLPGVTRTARGWNVTCVTPARKCSLLLRETGLRVPMECGAAGRSRSILIEGADLTGAEYAFVCEDFPDGTPDGIYPDIYARAFAGLDDPERQGGPLFAIALPDEGPRQEDPFPEVPMAETVIYEAHVKGFTADDPGAKAPGTFAALEDKLDYLQDLGVTALELLPVFEFDRSDNPNRDPETGAGLVNYWGYATLGYFAPKASYSGGDPRAELKSLAGALHRRGMELWLDVVYNHTGGKKEAPLFTGLGDYYFPEPLANISGCGNTVSCNSPEALRFVLRSLEYWRTEYRVDGFRFDLCPVLARDTDGAIREDAPLIRAITESPALQGCKLIAEPWDAGGGYMAGVFAKQRGWAEWNGFFRDTARRFLTEEKDVCADMAKCIEGSRHIFPGGGAVNFVTCHDGFTLYDLFTYTAKRNERNGEDNRDGSDHNLSCNMGHEGPADPETEARRRLRAVSALALLFLSRGTPMLLMGDEVLRTKEGNNNTYCQDNRLSRFPWDAPGGPRDLTGIVRWLTGFRKACPPTGERFRWHGTHPGKPDHSWASHSLAWEYETEPGEKNDNICRVYAAANMFSEPLTFVLPRGEWTPVFADGRPLTAGEPVKETTVRPGAVTILVTRTRRHK